MAPPLCLPRSTHRYIGHPKSRISCRTMRRTEQTRLWASFTCALDRSIPAEFSNNCIGLVSLALPACSTPPFAVGFHRDHVQRPFVGLPKANVVSLAAPIRLNQLVQSVPILGANAPITPFRHRETKFHHGYIRSNAADLFSLAPPSFPHPLVAARHSTPQSFHEEILLPPPAGLVRRHFRPGQHHPAAAHAEVETSVQPHR